MSGIYLHIPFCDTKCIYCDFYSITNHENKNRFLTSIIKEIEYYSNKLQDRTFDTVFFGGGTPSLMDLGDFERIFEALYKNYSISNQSEITIEANPGTLTKEKLADFRKLPVNRMSFGVQSFIDSDLEFLTRIHTAEEAISSVRTAQDSGFDNLNIDLIFALPKQTLEMWQYNLNQAVSLNTKHISAYSLIFEEGTVLNNLKRLGKVKEIDIELEREMFDFTSEFLKEHGFEHYEISNFAMPGYECRHNLKYWQRQEYISFGPSASSFISSKRWTNIKNLNKYIERIELNTEAKDFEEVIDEDKAVNEFIFLGLRSKGIDVNDFNQLFKSDFKNKYLHSISVLVYNGFAKMESDILRLTPKGYAVCDEIAARYF